MGKAVDTKCAVSVCLLRVKARGLCKRHYESWLENAPDSEKAWRKSSYPSDDTLVLWAAQSRSFREVAERLGIRRESFRDYLKIRPELQIRVTSALVKPTAEEVAQNNLDAHKRWKAANTEKVREYNRRWAKNQAPENRARWNSYNRERRKNAGASLMTKDDLEYAGIVRKDPCVYCNKSGGTLEHIIPVESGGDSSWENQAGACHSCNASKNDTSLLHFLLRRVA